MFVIFRKNAHIIKQIHVWLPHSLQGNIIRNLGKLNQSEWEKLNKYIILQLLSDSGDLYSLVP